jgi:hypothetical protein
MLHKRFTWTGDCPICICDTLVNSHDGGIGPEVSPARKIQVLQFIWRCLRRHDMTLELAKCDMIWKARVMRISTSYKLFLIFPFIFYLNKISLLFNTKSFWINESFSKAAGFSLTLFNYNSFFLNGWMIFQIFTKSFEKWREAPPAFQQRILYILPFFNSFWCKSGNFFCPLWGKICLKI